MFIADAQSAHGDLTGALDSLRDLPIGSHPREMGQALVAIRQAQRGNVPEAQRLLEGVMDQDWLDRARYEIAKAQARNGNGEQAMVTASLICDEYRKVEARKVITACENGEYFSPEQIPSPYLSGQVAALSLFSSDSSGKRAVFLTLAAAYRKDPKALTIAAEKSIAELRGMPKGLDRTTGYALLALAFSEVGETAKAEQARDQALKAMPEDTAGISNLFANPILTYAMIRLGHYEDTDTFVEAAEQNEDSLKRIQYSSVLEAIGAALMEKREEHRLESIYHRLNKPINRAHLAIGALLGSMRP